MKRSTRAPVPVDPTAAAADGEEPATADADETATPPAATLTGEHRSELFREATVMVLYVAVVEIAELAALPETHSGSQVSGPVGRTLLAIVWGTALGLALAHWFAFQLAAPAFRGNRPTRVDWLVGAAQFSGAAFVAVVSSLPVLLFSSLRARETIGDIPALLVGAIGFLVARRVGMPGLASVAFGITALALGVLVAVVKTTLSAH